MKLVKSIVILQKKDLGIPVVDIVLLVKHPEGCDPVERIHAAIGSFAKTKRTGEPQALLTEFTLSDLFRDIQAWDWSSQGIFIEEAPVWSVIDCDELEYYAEY